MTPQAFQKALHKWYNHNKRDLPWRNISDPYRIWLSEVILQQTRVMQGLPYYEAFTERYPRVELLAAADEKEVLRLWQGLGYYSRARNLHACAKEIVERYNGKFPDTYSEIIKLKGVGPYTAAAIASFAFREPVAVFDGNVNRVLSRIYGIEQAYTSPEGRKVFWDLANDLIDKKAPDLYNQAIMEFGALHCTPVNPSCEDCIFEDSCFANRNSLQKSLPVKKRKVKVSSRFFYYIVLEFESKYLLKRRGKADIWEGLFDFHLIEGVNPLDQEEINDILFNELRKNNLELYTVSNTYTHKLTHQIIHASFLHYKLNDGCLAEEILKMSNLAFYSMEEVLELPKPILVHRYLEEKIYLVKLDI